MSVELPVAYVNVLNAEVRASLERASYEAGFVEVEQYKQWLALDAGRELRLSLRDEAHREAQEINKKAADAAASYLDVRRQRDADWLAVEQQMADAVKTAEVERHRACDGVTFIHPASEGLLAAGRQFVDGVRQAVDRLNEVLERELRIPLRPAPGVADVPSGVGGELAGVDPVDVAGHVGSPSVDGADTLPTGSVR